MPTANIDDNITGNSCLIGDKLYYTAGFYSEDNIQHNFGIVSYDFSTSEYSLIIKSEADIINYFVVGDIVYYINSKGALYCCDTSSGIRTTVCGIPSGMGIINGKLRYVLHEDSCFNIYEYSLQDGVAVNTASLDDNGYFFDLYTRFYMSL